MFNRRPTTRSLMGVIALAAVASLGVRLRQASREYARRAEEHEVAAKGCWLDALHLEERAFESPGEEGRRLRGLALAREAVAGDHTRLGREYRAAAGWPWRWFVGEAGEPR